MAHSIVSAGSLAPSTYQDISSDGRDGRVVFEIRGCRCTWKPVGRGTLQIEKPGDPLPYQFRCTLDDARRKASKWVDELRAGKVPLEAVHRKAEVMNKGLKPEPGGFCLSLDAALSICQALYSRLATSEMEKGASDEPISFITVKSHLEGEKGHVVPIYGYSKHDGKTWAKVGEKEIPINLKRHLEVARKIAAETKSAYAKHEAEKRVKELESGGKFDTSHVASRATGHKGITYQAKARFVPDKDLGSLALDDSFDINGKPAQRVSGVVQVNGKKHIQVKAGEDIHTMPYADYSATRDAVLKQSIAAMPKEWHDAHEAARAMDVDVGTDVGKRLLKPGLGKARDARAARAKDARDALMNLDHPIVKALHGEPVSEVTEKKPEVGQVEPKEEKPVAQEIPAPEVRPKQVHDKTSASGHPLNPLMVNGPTDTRCPLRKRHRVTRPE